MTRAPAARRRAVRANPNDVSRIIYLMGASGVGKDTLLRYARDQTTVGCPWVVAHRYITRDVDPETENHIALTQAEFDHREAAGLFALQWASHGYHYGIGIEIDQWLARGVNVLINGSRAYLHQARARYPGLLPVKITVSDAVREQRLNDRGRETERDLHARLERADDLDHVHCPGLEEICNDGPIAVAGNALLALCRSKGQAR